MATRRTLIEHGTLIDGLGNAPFKGSVLFDESGILAVGEMDPAVTADPALTRIDARGKHVMPGMIDAHCHIISAWTCAMPSRRTWWQGRA